MTPQEIERRRRALAQLGMTEEDADRAVATLGGGDRSPARPQLRVATTAAQRRQTFEAEVAEIRANRDRGLAILAGVSSTPATQSQADSIEVELVPNSGKAVELPKELLGKIGTLAAWLLKKTPVAEGEPPMTQEEATERAHAIIAAFKGAGVQLTRQRKPVLLLSAHRGGNNLQKMMAALQVLVPSTRKTPLDQRIALARDFLDAARGRIL